ncbi:heme-binding protein [Bremerella cremea]|nr:heme-binding protein [Bremerella cremea]
MKVIAAICAVGLLVLAGGTGMAAEGDKEGKADAPLPQGWPKLTDVGKIEVKAYPAYRTAVAEAKGSFEKADTMLFWQLFAHIQANRVEMTAPVINTYDDEDGKSEIEMEFVYRQPDQGKAGPGLGKVVVENREAEDFLTLGYRGGMNEKAFQAGLEKLRAWLKEQSTWKEAGQPRRLGYNGPMTPVEKRYWEIQIPVVKEQQ